MAPCSCEEKNRALLSLMLEDRVLAGDWLGSSFDFPADYFNPRVQVYFHKPCGRLLRFIAPDQLEFLYCRFKNLDFKDSTELRNFYITHQRPTWFQKLKQLPAQPYLEMEALDGLMGMGEEKNPLAEIRDQLVDLRRRRAILEDEEKRLVFLEERVAGAYNTLKRVRDEEQEARRILREVGAVLD